MRAFITVCIYVHLELTTLCQAQIHELGGSLECPKSYVFRGGKDYSPELIQQMLGLGMMKNVQQPQQQQMPNQAPRPVGAHRYV